MYVLSMYVHTCKIPSSRWQHLVSQRSDICIRGIQDRDRDIHTSHQYLLLARSSESTSGPSEHSRPWNEETLTFVSLRNSACGLSKYFVLHTFQLQRCGTREFDLATLQTLHPTAQLLGFSDSQLSDPTNLGDATTFRITREAARESRRR